MSVSQDHIYIDPKANFNSFKPIYDNLVKIAYVWPFKQLMNNVLRSYVSVR